MSLAVAAEQAEVRNVVPASLRQLAQPSHKLHATHPHTQAVNQLRCGGVLW